MRYRGGIPLDLALKKEKRIVEIRCSMIIALKRRVNISLDNFVSLCKEYSILQKLVGYFSI